MMPCPIALHVIATTQSAGARFSPEARARGLNALLALWLLGAIRPTDFAVAEPSGRQPSGADEPLFSPYGIVVAGFYWVGLPVLTWSCAFAAWWWLR